MNAHLQGDNSHIHSSVVVVVFGTMSRALEQGDPMNDETTLVLVFVNMLTAHVRIHPPTQEPTQPQMDKALFLRNLMAEGLSRPVPFRPAAVPPQPEGLDWLFLEQHHRLHLPNPLCPNPSSKICKNQTVI